MEITQTSAAMQAYLKGTDLENILQETQAADGSSPIDAFTDKLTEQIDQVNETMQASDTKTEGFLAGEDTSIHEVMVAMTKADISFRLMTQVGKRVLDAYQEISRMQV